MSERIVKLKLNLIDCLDNDAINTQVMFGTISENPRRIRYTEEDANTEVELLVLENELHLTRQYDGNTKISFYLDKQGQFEIKDELGSFSGTVKTLKILNQNDLIYVHYRLYTNDDLITEQKMELSIQEAKA